VPRGGLGRRPRHDVGQLPQRAGGAARAQPRDQHAGGGRAGDLSHVYRSLTTRADARLNTQPTFYPALTKDVKAGDPFTPLLRAYEDDNVQIRILVGAHEEGHNFEVQGIKWKFEPGTPEDPASVNNSGYRNNQMMGISEHYEFVVPKLPKNFQGNTADYLYRRARAWTTSGTACGA
jgi:hypothetical protein